MREPEKFRKERSSAQRIHDAVEKLMQMSPAERLQIHVRAGLATQEEVDAAIARMNVERRA